MARPSAEQRKLMIIETVLALFKEKGMSASSTRDVAERAGIARSHVYHYFKDWTDLSICAVEYFSYNQINELEKCFLSMSATKALSLFVVDNLPISQDASWRIYLDAWDASLCDKHFAESYIKIIESWHALLKKILDKGISSGEFIISDSGKVSRQIISIINGYADDLILDPTPMRAELAKHEIMDVVNKLVAI